MSRELKKQLEEWGAVILRASIILVVLFFFCWPVRLMGSSMEPTIADGDIVLMSRFAVMQRNYEKGDIVLFYYFDETGERTVMKRIIGTEGDRIRILPDGIEVNGVLLDETYAFGETEGLVDMEVPPNMVFLLGDN